MSDAKYVEIVNTGSHLDGCKGQELREVAPGCVLVKLTDGRQVSIGSEKLRAIEAR